MTKRAYVLLIVEAGKSEHVASVLRGSAGVLMADAVDGSSNVIAVLESSGRKQLTEDTIQAIVAVEEWITEEIRIFPTLAACPCLGIT